MTSPEQFTKVPNSLMDWLARADLNMTQFRIVNAVIRYTFGFHRNWCYLALSKLSEHTGCNRRQIVRELNNLLDRGILLERMKGRQRELCINQKGLASDSLDTSASVSLVTTASDSLDTNIKKDFKESIKEIYYLDLTNEDHIFIKIYLNLFKTHLGKEHMRVSNKSYDRIMKQVLEWEENGVQPEEWGEQADFHLQTLPPKNNGNIAAFLKAAPRYFL